MKQTTKWAAIALMMATTVLTGCSSESDNGNQPVYIIDPVEPSTFELTRAEQVLVNHNNDFAFSLLREITKNQSIDKSEIVSPISITYALGMLNNGAAGETQAQINKVLGFGSTGAEGINTFCHKMLNVAPLLDPQTKVMIANTIYMNKGYELNTDFTLKAKSFYNAEPETRDFFDGKTMDVINQWASDHTEGMIDKVLDEESFKPYAVSYLLNAIYFKGSWTAKFNKDNTKDEEFQTPTGKKLVPTMRQEGEFNYSEDTLYQALRLPYGNQSYSMTILLPKEGRTISDVLQSLTAETWQRFQWMGEAIVNIKLPRFESKTDVDLKPVMTALGMPNAFIDGVAEFPDFCNVETYIDLMKQVAKIKLDEEGSEASAVTVIGMINSTSVGTQEPLRVNFHATRPFLYIISEQSTGAIFFIGKYVGD